MTVFSAQTIRPAPASAFPPLLRAVARAYDVPAHEIMGRKRARWSAWPRQALYLLAGDLFAWGSPRVARVMNVDPTTVLRGRRAATDRINCSDAERQRFKRAMTAYIQEFVAMQSSLGDR